MKILRPKSEILWLGTVDDGKQLLINTTIEGVSHDLVTIRADDHDESLWIELCVEGKIVQIPLSLLKEAVELAPGEVHSETWYENNVYGDEGA